MVAIMVTNLFLLHHAHLSQRHGCEFTLQLSYIIRVAAVAESSMSGSLNSFWRTAATNIITMGYGKRISEFKG